MNFFQKKTTWTNYEFIPLKLAIATIYLVLGIFFHDELQGFVTPLLVLFAITVIVAVRMWWRKMNQENN